MNPLVLYSHHYDFVAVALSGVIVYHQDSDEGCHNDCFSADEVAYRLAEALGGRVDSVEVMEGRLPDDWNFDDVEDVARAYHEGRPWPRPWEDRAATS